MVFCHSEAKLWPLLTKFGYVGVGNVIVLELILCIYFVAVLTNTRLLIVQSCHTHTAS